MKVSKIISDNIIQATQKAVRQVSDVSSSRVSSEVSERSLPSQDALNISHFPKFAMCQSHKAEGGLAIVYPDSYVKIERVFVPEYEYTIKRLVRELQPDGTSKLVRKKVTQLEPERWEEIATWLPHYHIDKLWSTGKSSGTNSVQAVVRQSLEDPKTQGRVMLDACCIDEKTSPGGFYYKLGFRFIDEEKNQKCAKWLMQGGKREDAPWAVGVMYLPKENISHCLNYKVNSRV